MEKGYLGIEIGEKLIRFVYVTKQKGGYTLTRAGQIEVNLNFNSPGALTHAIRNVVEKEELLPKRIFTTISRKDVLIHQQFMPRMNAAELSEVVPDEIEKIPFFYNQAFEYSYTAFVHNKEKDRILLVAVAQEFLRSVIDEVDGAKLPFRDIEIAPLNLKDILPKQRGANRCEAILVVQELCSYFCIYKGDTYLGIYRSPVGSEQIMSTVNVNNQDHMISNWVGEFERVVKSHNVDHPQTPIEQVWLIADKSVCFQFSTKLSKSLDINTEILNSTNIPNLIVSETIDWNPKYAAALTPLMFAITGKKPLFALDHFFAKFQAQKYVMLMLIKSIIFLAVLISGLGGMNYFVKKDLVFLSGETVRLNTEIQLLNRKNKHLFDEKNAYLDVRKKLLAQAGYVQEINRTSWTHVLASIATELPAELSLTGFKFAESGDVQIKGETFDITNIAEMIRKIDQSSILEGGKFEFLKEKKLEEAKIFDFGIQANLKGKKEENNGPKKN
ncbi:MAG: PilN domain-containing protein [Candidatus Omnitrophica bacterium]|nr:PilN domain-containing protein [Candidatus Omnitrophota bacterium]